MEAIRYVVKVREGLFSGSAKYSAVKFNAAKLWSRKYDAQCRANLVGNRRSIIDVFEPEILEVKVTLND